MLLFFFQVVEKYGDEDCGPCFLDDLFVKRAKRHACQYGSTHIRVESVADDVP